MRSLELIRVTGANPLQRMRHDHHPTEPATAPQNPNNLSSTYSPPRKTPRPPLILGLPRRWRNTFEG
jgi:hypothetical protein